MWLSIFVDKLKENIIEDGKEKEVVKDVFVVSGHKFLALSENIILDGETLRLGIADWLELSAVVVRLENRILHESIKNLYETIYIYTLPYLFVKRLAEEFGEEREMAIRGKEV